MSPVVGVDLGGSNMRAALIEPNGSILARDRRPTEAEKGLDAVIDNLIASIDAVSDDTVTMIGIGVPGPIDTSKGIVYSPPNLPGWGHVPLRNLVAKRTGKRVVIENDANAWGLGEAWLGAGRDRNSMILLTLGTGIGGCLILNGAVWHGAHGVGCEIGHMVYEPNGVPCGCGNRGCLEKYASASGIVRRATEAIQAGVETTLLAESITSKAITQAATNGDRLAQRLLEETGRILGTALATLSNLFDPELFVIGGGVAAAGERLFGPMREELAARAITMPSGLPTIVLPILGGDAGILGAARLVIH